MRSHVAEHVEQHFGESGEESYFISFHVCVGVCTGCSGLDVSPTPPFGHTSSPRSAARATPGRGSVLAAMALPTQLEHKMNEFQGLSGVLAEYLGEEFIRGIEK